MNIDFAYMGVQQIQKLEDAQLLEFWDNIPDWYEEIRDRNWEGNDSAECRKLWAHLQELEDTARDEMTSRNLQFTETE